MTISDEFQVNTETIDNQKNPEVTGLSDGGFVVTWESEREGSNFNYGV